MRKAFAITVILAVIGSNSLKAQFITANSSGYSGNISHVSGNVGIGLSSSLWAKLTIGGTNSPLQFYNNINGIVNMRKYFFELNPDYFSINAQNDVNSLVGTLMVFKHSGNIGIGTTTPNNKLEINYGTAGNSGLRFTQLTSATAAIGGNGKFLSVNATGDVVLVDGGSSASNWNLTGNSGTSSTANFIGTTDLQDFVFKTNDSERIRIKGTGNIGIGIATPLNKLHIDAGNAIASYTQFTTGTTTGQTATDGTLFGTDATGNTVVKQQENLPILFYTNNAERMRLSSIGNIGIGIANPLNKLHIDAGNAIASYTQFTAGTTTGQTAMDGTLFGTDATGNTIIKQQEYKPLIIYTANTEWLRITENGNVGIGTPNPALRLTISGGQGTGIRLFNDEGDDYWDIMSEAQGGNFYLNNGTFTPFFINYTTGNIGIGTTTPNNKLEINHGTAGNSGLRFTQLTSASPSITNNGKVLSVNTTGDVILTDAGASTSTWSSLGNSGTTTSNFIGTTDLQDFVVKTNNIQRMRFSKTGDVMMGYNNNPVLTLQNDGNPAGTETINFFTEGLDAQIINDNGSLKLKSSQSISFTNLNDDDNIKFLYNGTVLMNKNKIAMINGNVGIGTITPNSILETYKLANASSVELLRLSNGGNDNLTGAHINFYLASINFGRIESVYNTVPMINFYPDFHTKSTPTLSIGKDNVGIGTTNPQSVLEVNKSINDVWTTSIKNNGGSSKGLSVEVGYGGDNVSTIMQLSDANGNVRMKVQSNGNVGIGTTAPRSRLDIGTVLGAGKGLRVGDYIEINERETINNASCIGFNACIDATDVSKFKPTYFGASSANGMLMTMASGGDSSIDFYGITWGTDNTPKSLTDFTHVLRLGTNGNVGIGTTNPLYKLSVKGTIGCGEVKVEVVTGWADFVFKPSYKLRSLGEVEQFIKTNNHLPEIPTEAEVKENGVGLGEMNAKLLQKVEEITLYLIDQQKQINELKEQNAKLVNEIQSTKK